MAMVSDLVDQEGNLPQGEKPNYPKKHLWQQNYRKDRSRKRSAKEHRTTGGPYLHGSSVRRSSQRVTGPSVQEQKFKIAYWYCRSACQDEFLDTLTIVMIERKRNQIALNETHFRRSDTSKCCDNFSFAHSGKIRKGCCLFV